jgi:hypothetical protein
VETIQSSSEVPSPLVSVKMEVSMYMSNPVSDAGKAQMPKLNKKSGAAQQTLFKRAVEMKRAMEENTQRIPLRQEAGEVSSANLGLKRSKRRCCCKRAASSAS